MERFEAKRLQVLKALLDAEQVRRQGGLVASQIMTAAPSAVKPETSVLDLIRLFHARGFRHLLVIDDLGHLVGLVSDRDIIQCFGLAEEPTPEALGAIKAWEIMSRDLVTIGPDTPLEEALSVMVEQGINCLPVVAAEAPVGILTNTDLCIALQLLLQTIRQSSLEQSIAAGVTIP
ncbi:MAG: CBS domain-containing protein [Pirellulales bacterium]